MWKRDELRPLANTAPNAMLERMRRRISPMGWLVAAVSLSLSALVVGVIYACARFR